MSNEALTSCEECRSAVRSGGAWTRYDSYKCLYCAARLLQSMARRPAGQTRERISERRTAALKDIVGFGLLKEEDIRALVRGDMAVSPAAKTDVKRNP